MSTEPRLTAMTLSLASQLRQTGIENGVILSVKFDSVKIGERVMVYLAIAVRTSVQAAADTLTLFPYTTQLLPPAETQAVMQLLKQSDFFCTEYFFCSVINQVFYVLLSTLKVF